MSDDLIHVIDDALPKEVANRIERMLKHSDFPWYWGTVFYSGQDATSNDTLDDGCEELDNSQLCHIFHNGKSFEGDYANKLQALYDLLQIKAFVRVKANLVPKRDRIFRHGFHYDQSFLCKVAVYYVNNTNGYTEFENGKKVYGVKNRLVIFPSNMKHSGSTCTNAKARFVINFNFF